MDKTEFKAARKRKSMTQKELSLYLGVTISAVQKWETGQNKIPPWVVERLNRGQSITLTGLSSDEIAAFERRAAQKGVSADSRAAELIKMFIKLGLIAFAALHLYRVGISPKTCTASAFADTGRAAVEGLGKAAKIAFSKLIR